MKASFLCGAHYAGASAHRAGVSPNECDPHIAQESFARWLGYAAMADELGRTVDYRPVRDTCESQALRSALVTMPRQRGLFDDLGAAAATGN